MVFISKLEMKIKITARLSDESLEAKNRTWFLEIETTNGNTIEKGILMTARDEIRRFKQLNSIFIFIQEIFGAGTAFNVCT